MKSQKQQGMESNHCLNLISNRRMKLHLIFFLALVSMDVLSEKYVCKIIVDKTTNTSQTHLFEREGDFFNHSVDYRKLDPFKIIRETDRYVLLNKFTRIVMIEKSTEEVAQYWIGVPQPYKPEYGDCSVTTT